MKKPLNSLIATAAIIIIATISGNADAAKLPKNANTTCPVMLKEEVNPDMHIDHKGQRIYFCCTKCKRRFLRDPEKYLARLPKNDEKSTTTRKLAQPQK